LTGNEGLKKRPMEPLLKALNQLGVKCYSTRNNGRLPIIVFGGGIKGGKALIRGDISSQFISGLLFGLPKAHEKSKIILTSPIESKPYIELTLNFLRKHKIDFEYPPDFSWFSIPGNQQSISCNHLINGDFSSAAFLLAAASIINSRVKVTNLPDNTLQGDQIILTILKNMGVSLRTEKKCVEIQTSQKNLSGMTLDVKDIPDLAPICAVLACYAKGDSKIFGIRRLRFKESNRSYAISEELKKMGGKVKENEDSLEIRGINKLRGAELDSHEDHRIAMALTVAALSAHGDSIIHGIECINKSYPDFIKDLKMLGGRVYIK
jgi:3-phosphoshikimate 1-carboxyvinyltransferase